MKKFLLFLLLPCFVQAQTYTLTRNLSNNLISGSGTSVALTDDSFAGALPIGFPFNFYGNNYTNFFLCSNGFISFGAGSTGIHNIIPSTQAPNNVIAFANADLDPGIGSPTINYFTTGSSPNRILVVNFNNVRHFSNMSLTTVQVQLFETSNKIEIHSTNNVSGGDIRAIAVENIDGTQGVTEPSLDNTTSFNVVNEMIRFTPSVGTCATPVITANTPFPCVGFNVTFTATGIPANTPLQWQRNGIDIQGATGTTYSPPLFGFDAAGGFRVRSGTCSSNTLTIIPFVTITTSTANLCEGQSVTFEITNYFEFTNPPIWTRDGVPINGAFGPTYTTSQAGTYSVIVINSNCPVPIFEITPKPATPTASVTVQPSCSTPTGTILITAPTGANLQYSINGNTYQTSTTFSGLTPGNYSVTVKNTLSNCISNTLSLAVNASSAIPVITANTTFLCEGSNVTFTATGLPANTPLQWQRNGVNIQGATATTYTPSFGMPGNYRVVTASCTSNVITINPSQLITANTPNLCEGQSVTFTVPNFHFFIEMGTTPMWMRNGQPILDASGPSYTTSQAGIYSIISNGVFNTCPSNIVEITPKPATPTASVTVQPSCSVPTGTIVVTAPTGMNLQYSVNGSTYQTSPTFSGLTPGNYSLTVKNTDTGCISNTLSLAVNASSATPVITSNTPFLCSLENITFTATGVPANTPLQWQRNGIDIQGATATTYTPPIGHGAAGVYRVRTASCNSNTLTIQPSALLVTSNPSRCEGQNVIIEILNYFEFSIPPIWTRNGEPINAMGATHTTSQAGIYSVIVVNSMCPSTILAITPKPATPTASVTVQPNCTTPTGTIVITAPTGMYLQYSVNGSTYQTSPTFSGLAAGTYSVTVKNTDTGCISNTLSLAVNAVPTAPVITANTTFLCEGSNVTFTATGIPANTPMQWQRNDINIQGATSNTYTPPFGMPGNYRVVTASCTSNVITINPSQLITANTPNLCEGQSVTFTVPNFHFFIEMGITPMWMRNGQPIPDAFGPSYTTSQVGMYSIISNGVFNTCPSNIVEITPKPATPTASVSVQPSCSVSTGTIVVTAPTGANLQYSINGNTYQASTTFSGLAPGNYSVTVKNTVSNCISNPIALTVNAVPTAPVITANTTFLCEGSNVTFTATGIPANTPLQWKRNGTNIQGATATTYTPPAGMPGNYTVATASCTSNTMTINPNRFILANTNNLCEGQNITLSIPNFHYFIEMGLNPMWFRNGQPIADAFGPSYTTSQAGLYDIFVPGPNTCPSSFLEITPKPATPTASVTVQPSCSVPTGTIVVTAPTGANLQYSINGNTYQASTTFSGLTPGNYSVTVKNTVSNCISNGLSLTVNAVPTVSVGGTVSNNQVICPNTSPTNLNLSGQVGNILKWQRADNIEFSSPTDISHTGAVLASATIGILSSTTYFRAVVQSPGCNQAFSSIVTITVQNVGLPITLTSPADDVAPLTSKNVSASTISASNVISTTANASYTATHSVILTPNFEAKRGSTFVAQIGGCSP